MYTRQVFGKELKERVAQQNDISEIASWAFAVYLGDSPVDDVEFNRILIILNTMEEGPEFEISYERLNEIADDLIDGKTNINMDYQIWIISQYPVFGKELKERVTQQNDISEIASWAFAVYLGDSPVDDVEFNRILIILNTMEEGPEFEISYERLNEIADDLIDGKTNINMDYQPTPIHQETSKEEDAIEKN